MFNHLRLSYSLLRLANSVLDRRKEKFKKELEILKLSERELNEVLDCLIGIKDHLVRKMCIYWLKKKTIILPEDLPKVEKAKDLIKGNRGIDYLTFDSPVEIIDKFEEKAQIEFDKLIKPDSLPELYNKVDLGEGVTVYTVENTKEGQYAVRKLADSHFGEGFDNWCITGRYPSLYPDKERDDMGMILDSFYRWKNTYNAYPKRVAFKNGLFFAFCGNSEKKILWWNQGNDPFYYIPKHKHLDDDQNFIDKYINEKGDHFETDIKKMGQLDAKRVLESDRASFEFKLMALEAASFQDKINYINNITDKNVLQRLSKFSDNGIRKIIAHHSHSTEGILLELSKDEDEDVRDVAFYNHNSSEAVWVNVIQLSNMSYIRDYLESRQLSMKSLIALSKSSNKDVRLCIAEKKMPVEILDKLSNDEEEKVRLAVAKNINASPETLAKMIRDKSLAIIQYIIENPNTPIEALVELSNDDYSYVRSMIAKYSKIPADVLIKLSKDIETDVRESVAVNSNTPPDVLDKLSNDKHYRVRCGVARNSNTSAAVLAKLSSDESDSVRISVAWNSNAPVDVLVRLSDDENVQVRFSVTKNPNTTAEVLIKLSSDKVYKVRQSIAEASNIPEDVLVKLSKDEHWRVRYSVAGNPNTPDDVLVKLSKAIDEEVNVRGIALNSLEERGIYV